MKRKSRSLAARTSRLFRPSTLVTGRRLNKVTWKLIPLIPAPMRRHPQVKMCLKSLIRLLRKRMEFLRLQKAMMKLSIKKRKL